VVEDSRGCPPEGMGPARSYRPRGHIINTNTCLYWTEPQPPLEEASWPTILEPEPRSKVQGPTIVLLEPRNEVTDAIRQLVFTYKF